jgi:hypothetical protein
MKVRGLLETESETQTTKELLMDVIKNDIGLDDVSDDIIKVCYRIGPKKRPTKNNKSNFRHKKKN